MSRRLHLRSIGGAGLIVAMLAVPACSDDGVLADEAGTTGSTGGVSSTDPTIDPTTQTTSVTTTSSSSGTSSSTTDSTSDPTRSETTNNDSSGTDPSATTDGSSGAQSDSSSDTSSSESTAGTGESGNGGLPTGDACANDNDCASGVCWDFADYDPQCGGTACSASCRSDVECQQLILDAGGEFPEQSYCGDDGRCWMLGSGFGQYFCAGG